MNTCREMIQTNFRYAPYAEDGRGLSVYHHLCLNIFMLRVWGMGQGSSMLKEVDPQMVEGVSSQWGLGRGRTLGVPSRVRKKES